MKKITFLGLCIISTTLFSCSTSTDDQFKYVAPPPTQGSLNSNGSDLNQSKEVVSQQKSKNNT